MATIGMFTLIGAASGALVGGISGAIWHIAHKPTATSDESKPPSEPPRIAPSLTFKTYMQPDESYFDGTVLAGIVWRKEYVDVRLDVANRDVPIQNLDFLVSLDTSIAGVGQISQFPGVIAYPAGSPHPTWLQGTDLSGNPASVPLGMASMAPVYRVQCSKIFANTVLHFVVASIALNPVENGRFPAHLFAAKRHPNLIKIKGTYETQNGGSVESHNVDFSYDFTQPPSPPAPEKKKRERRSVQSPAAPAPTQPPSISQECAPGANCAISNGQQGGITAGQVILTAPQRNLTDEQKRAFSEMVAALPSGVRLAIECVGNDEAAHYGYEMFKLMTEDHGMGWAKHLKPPDAEDKGLWLQINKDDQPVAQDIINRLKAANFDIDQRTAFDPKAKKGQLQLWVGTP